ncbi:PREDICTED: uncharacterized protein LOC109584866 [Amphimedon queenslandica]|uniref:Coiled-coil domain-containing protein n=2 Tax=Amphimedon queenslandica TaxID=400682 RepID=A0AAN0JHS5_AMPQE|nr:PREDICTED: uncharacterized protein LOC109584866 [Amphimedon queenslandica]|eukprot:XP_019856322.1 PREDICTED: uncharacterized protein LOC109584866 [Amphimedon queenslandica]
MAEIFESELHSQILSIQEKLKSQSERLLIRERELKERNDLLIKQFSAIQEMEELLGKRQKKLQEKEENLEARERMISAKREQMEHVQADLEEKCDSLVTRNDDLMSQVLSLQSQIAKMKAKKKMDEHLKEDQLPLKTLTNSLMHWLTRLQLQANSLSPLDKTMKETTLAMSLDILPSLVNHMTLNHVTPSGVDTPELLTLLEFVHLSTSTLAEEEHHTTVITSLRRLGEKIEKFVPNENVQVDVLCSLISLHTITQVYKLANILERLTAVLKSSKVQQLFMLYRGMDAMFSLLKNEKQPVVLTSKVLDILIDLMPEPVFVERCTSRNYYSTVLSCLRRPSLHVTNLEKISILLQRTSKYRSVCHLLQSLNGVQTIKSSLIQNSSNHFVQLNLKSTLNNIDNHIINTTARTCRSE